MDTYRLCIVLFSCFAAVSCRVLDYTGKLNQINNIINKDTENLKNNDAVAENLTDTYSLKTLIRRLHPLWKIPKKYRENVKTDYVDQNNIAQENDKVTDRIFPESREHNSRRKRSSKGDLDIYESELINECSLYVKPESVKMFRRRVLYDRATALLLNLRLPADIHKHVIRSQDVILPLKWRWVYRDTLPYLQMPYAANVWSLGLLSLHSGREVNVELSYMNKKKICQNYNWSIGDTITDKIIGNALGQMTTKVVAVNDLRYDTSHWCYMRKIPRTGSDVYPIFDDNFFSTSPSLEYTCCKYTHEMSENTVICERTHKYDPVWWDVPLGLGILMLLYFPMLLMKVNGVIHKKILESCLKPNGTPDGNGQAGTDTVVHGPTEVVTFKERNDKVYLKGNSPVTAMSIILSAISHLLPSKQSTKSRMAIFAFPLFTLLIPGIELLIYYCFVHDYAVDLAKNNISIGFSGVLAGWKANEMKFSIFGGPYIALGIYLIIGWVLMLTPKVMADQIYNGVFEGYRNSKSVLTISLEDKERLGSVKVKKQTNGYFRLFKLQKCHIYMLVNPDFWICVAQIDKNRWISFLTTLEQCVHYKAVAIIISIPILPLYVAMSVAELVVTVFLYAVPLFSFIVCVLRGFTLGLNKYISEKFCTSCARIGAVLRFPIGMFVFGLVFYFTYIFTVLFFDGFFFLSRILMFTYTAVVAYPRETYGYFMLFLISAYYGLEGFFHFGDIYKSILKICVKLCKQDVALQGYLYHYKEDNDADVYGISKDMFEYLVEQIRPRRVQALHSVIKFVSVVFVLSVSIVLMERFRNFEDLSLFVHIFVILFICALPTIYHFAISKKEIKTKLRKKVKKAIFQWTEKKKQRNGIVAVPSV